MAAPPQHRLYFGAAGTRIVPPDLGSIVPRLGRERGRASMGFFNRPATLAAHEKFSEVIKFGVGQWRSCNKSCCPV
jgi:hypothetical protein